MLICITFLLDSILIRLHKCVWHLWVLQDMLNAYTLISNLQKLFEYFICLTRIQRSSRCNITLWLISFHRQNMYVLDERMRHCQAPRTYSEAKSNVHILDSEMRNTETIFLVFPATYMSFILNKYLFIYCTECWDAHSCGFNLLFFADLFKTTRR